MNQRVYCFLSSAKSFLMLKASYIIIFITPPLRELTKQRLLTRLTSTLIPDYWVHLSRRIDACIREKRYIYAVTSNDAASRKRFAQLNACQVVFCQTKAGGELSSTCFGRRHCGLTQGGAYEEERRLAQLQNSAVPKIG